MTVNSPLYEALRRIRESQIPAADREMLRLTFAAMEAGQVMRLPEIVIKRIRDLDARLPKSK